MTNARLSACQVIAVGGAVRDITLGIHQGRFITDPHALTSQKLLAFEYGSKMMVPDAYNTLGGGATNVAVTLARLGVSVAALVRVGHDHDGTEVLANLEAEGVISNLIQRDRRLRSGFSCILIPERKQRDRIIFSYRGANDELVCKIPQSLRPEWLYISSLSGTGWQASLNSLYAFAKKARTSVMWNPGNQQLNAGHAVLAPWLRQTTVLILNKQEALALVLSGVKVGRRNPRFLNKPLYLLNILREWGPHLVVMTDGPRGAWAYDGSRLYYQKIMAGKVVDTTGVGDAFGASFLAGFRASKGNIPMALRWGMVNSAAVVKEVGAHNGLLRLAALRKKVGL